MDARHKAGHDELLAETTGYYRLKHPGPADRMRRHLDELGNREDARLLEFGHRPTFPTNERIDAQPAET